MANRKRRRSRRAQNNRLVLELLILVVLVLVVFEGRLILIMLSQRSGSSSVSVQQTAQQDNDDTGGSSSKNKKEDSSDSVTVGVAGFMARMSGKAIAGADKPASQDTEPETTAETTAENTSTDGQSSEAIDDPNVVPEQAESVDDSYFTDAVFIGDSRMEGFRNASGITQGDFLTSVGMTLTSLSTETVSTSEGQITVYQGLSGKKYNKIYLMLGANDLGFYPMSDFLSVATGALETIHELQPQAVIYICDVIYVEEAKVVTSYVNNANVQTVNGYLLEACQNLPYCYYVNLNEIFSDGYHELIYGASADGVHLNPEYLQQMLEYLKSHYLVVESAAEEAETE